jgi:DNA-binding Xre family transcriptional regulator
MIRSETEYQKAIGRVKNEKELIEKAKKNLKNKGLKSKEIERALNPLLSFTAQLEEEIETYEKIKRGDFETIENFDGLGRSLIALRINKNMSQKDLADKLKIAESQISRYEKNEYRGISMERVNEILTALHAKAVTKFEILVP